MKWLLSILGLGLAFVAGYNLEPSMRLQLTGVPAPSKGGTEPAELAGSDDATPPAPAPPAMDLSAFTREQLPDRVLLKSEVEVSDASSDVKMKIPAGSRVALVRIENNNVVVSPGGGPFEGATPVSSTDLLEQLAANPPPPASAVAQVDPAPAPAPEPVPQPEPVAQVDPQPEPTPAVAQTEPEMTPPVEPVAPAPTTPAAPTDIISIMQESIRSGQVKEFTVDSVLPGGWKAEADEVVDGETYQIGLAAYKAQTIFGVKTIHAKALIKDGKVVRWVYQKSGMEIQ